METTPDHTTSDQLSVTSDYDDIMKAETDPNHELAMTLLRAVIPVIVLMGTVGNALSFCVLVRRRMRSTPMYFYLTLLAVADTFVLYVSAFKVWIRAVTDFEVLHLSNVGCKLLMFILLCSFYMSAWLVVLVTLDRFLVVWFPFRGYLFMRIHRARLTAAALAIIVAVYNAHVFWTMNLYRFGSDPKCDAAEDNFFMTHIFEYLKLVSYCVVPFVVVIALNVGILFRINRVYTNATRREGGSRDAAAVYRHQTPMVIVGQSSSPLSDNPDEAVGGAAWPQRQQFALSTTQSTNRHQSSVNVQKLRQRRLTKMLLFISFAWLVLTAPFTLHSFLPEPPTSLTPSSFHSSLPSSLTTSNFSKSTSSVSARSTASQLAKSDGFLYHTDQEIPEDQFSSERLRKTATESFLAEDPYSFTSSTSVSTSAPPADVDQGRYLLVKTICFLLMYLNHAINFYLYCLTGRRFRRELAAMLNCGGLRLMCSESTEETVAAGAGAARGGGGMCEMAVLNGRREVNQNQQLADFVPLSNSQPSSTSSRTRYGRMINPVRRSSSELNNERFS